MLSQQEQQFQDDRPHPTVETFGISAETDAELWNMLQRSEDRQLRTYNADEMPASEVQRIFGGLPKLDAELIENAAPQGWAAIEPDDEPTQPMDPLPWSDVEIINLREDIARLEDRIDRDLAMLQQDISELERQISQQDLETAIQLRLMQQDWEPRLEVLENAQAGNRPYPFLLGESMRVAALIGFGFGITMLAAALVSGSQPQKDAFAETGAVLAVVGVAATAVGTALDD